MDRGTARVGPILFRRRGILTHRGTRINVDMDFVGRVALFVTQCNWERARLFPPLPVSPCPFSHSVFPRISTPASSFRSCSLFVPGYSTRCATGAIAHRSLFLALSSSEMMLGQCDAKTSSPARSTIRVFREKMYHFLTVCILVSLQHFDMIYNTDLLNHGA